MDIESATGPTITNKAIYQNIPIAGDQTIASVNFTDFQNPPVLNVDSDGDAITDLTLQPNAVLFGAQSADITPPGRAEKVLCRTSTGVY